MKSLIGTALVIGLLTGTSALAQEDHGHGEGRPASTGGPPSVHGGAGGGGAGGGGFHPPPTGPAPSFSRPTGPGPGPSGGGGDRHPDAYRPAPGGQGWNGGQGWSGDHRGQGGEYRPSPEVVRPDGDRYRPGTNGFRPGDGGMRPGEHGFRPGENGFHPGPNGYRPAFGAPGFRPGGERPRYSPQYFPRQLRAERQFEWRGGRWNGPPGFYYRRWNYGEYLPFGWFAAQWFMNDYWAYDLPVPPWGCEWIRSGPDALLVDVRTGFIVETVYGVFY